MLAASARPARLAVAGAVAWQLLGLAAAVLLLGWIAGQLMPVLLPVGVAVLIAALLHPVVRWLERAGVPSAAAALATMVVLVGLVAGLVYVIVPPFVGRLADLGSSIEQGAQQVAYSIGGHMGMDHAAVNDAIDRVAHGLRDHLGGLAGEAVTGATAIAGALGGAVLVVFLSFFLLKDGGRLWSWLVDLAPEDRRAGLWEAGRRSGAVLATYVRGVVFVATVDAVFIGLALVLIGVPLALPLIVLTWLAAFFPIVGAVTAGAAAVLVALVAKGLVPALIVLAAIVVVQQLEGNVLYPMVVGPRLKLHPIVVLLAVAAGGTIGGIPGAFLAVPVATVCAAVLEYVREQHADGRTLDRARSRRTRVPARTGAGAESHAQDG